MTTKIIHKKSSISGRIPDSADLEYGELALNYNDGNLFYKSSSNSILKFQDSDGTRTQIHNRIDARVTSAFLENLLPNHITTTSTSTVSNKTFTDPKIGADTQLFGQTYGGMSANVDTQLADSTQSIFTWNSIDSSRDAAISIGVPNQVQHTIGTVVDRDAGTSKMYFSVGDNTSGIQFTRRSAEATPPINFSGTAAPLDVLLDIAADGKIHVPNATNATSRTSAALTILGGLGVDKDIRAVDVYASNNVRAPGGFIGNVTGTVSDISNHNTGDLSEGSNLYYTNARADARIAAANTGDLSEGSNLYYTTGRADSDAKNAVSVTDNGGDGSLSYNAATGAITYVGPSAADTRAHFSGGTGVTLTNGSIAIGQDVATSASPTFAGGTYNGTVTITGDLNISGTQTQSSYVDLRVSEPIIKVADSNVGNTFDLGLVGRYSDDGGSTIRRAGFVRDASTGEFHVFDNLIQNGLDSSDPDKTINLDDSSVEYPIWNFGGLRGQYLGFDSDFQQFSTDYTLYESDFTAVSAGRYAVDTADGNINITLPASPTTGDYVRIIDAGNLTGQSATLLRNGSTIEGYTDDFELDIGQNTLEVLFINNTWNLYSAVGQRGPTGQKGDSADSSLFATQTQSIAFSIALG